jgi:hypothetical protein
MENSPTGRTRKNARTIGFLSKRIVLVHQTEMNCEYMSNTGGSVEIEDYVAWFDTRAEWLLEEGNAKNS